MLKNLSGLKWIAIDKFNSSRESEPYYWTWPISVLRATLASTLLLTLLVTPQESLFQPLYGEGDKPNCAAYRAIPNLFCLAPSIAAGQVLGIIILVVVVAGFIPQVTALAHYWVTYSFMDGAAVVDGGDQLATVLTLLVIPIALTDRRLNMWTRRQPPVNGLFVAIAGAFIIGIKCQMSILYLQASIAKLAEAEWLIGNNLYYTSIGQFGFPATLNNLVKPLMHNELFVAFSTWSVIALELLLGMSCFIKTKYRPWLFFGAVVLHGMIALLIGLWSFSLNMIAADFILLVPLASQLYSRQANSGAKT